MPGIKKTMEIIRTETGSWMIDNGISHSHAEDMYARIENALNAEKREQESINGFHVGDKVRVVRCINMAGGPDLPVPAETAKMVGTLHPNTFHDGMAEFEVWYENGDYVRVVTKEIEHA